MAGTVVSAICESQVALPKDGSEMRDGVVALVGGRRCVSNGGRGSAPFLLMSDHLHMLASFPEGASVKAVCGAWKRYVAGHFGIRFQTDFFEHRIRNGNELSEKWWYVRNNPVRKGLVGDADEWAFWIGYDPRTGRALR